MSAPVEKGAGDGCSWCGEPKFNCPDNAGECCCVSCHEYGAVVTHPRYLPPAKSEATDR